MVTVLLTRIQELFRLHFPFGSRWHPGPEECCDPAPSTEQKNRSLLMKHPGCGSCEDTFGHNPYTRIPAKADNPINPIGERPFFRTFREPK